MSIFFTFITSFLSSFTIIKFAVKVVSSAPSVNAYLYLVLGFLLFEFGSEIPVDHRARVVFGEAWSERQDVFVETFIEHVELGCCRTPHIEPPVAGEGHLVEYCPIGTEEGRLAAIQVAVVPYLKIINQN